MLFPLTPIEAFTVALIYMATLAVIGIVVWVKLKNRWK